MLTDKVHHMKTTLVSFIAAGLTGVLLLSTPAVAETDFLVTELSIMDSGSGEGGAEIPTYHAGSKQIFATNGVKNAIDIYDISDPKSPLKVTSVSMDSFGDGITSVAAGKNVIAVAVTRKATFAADGTPKLNTGRVVLMYPSGKLIRSVDLGAVQPDAVTFTPDGLTALVAIEGEPICALDNPATAGVDESTDYALAKDPRGAVAIIDARKPRTAKAKLAGFSNFDADELKAKGLVISLTSTNPAVDLEPETVTAPTNLKAYVSLQEANAIAELDIKSGKFTKIYSAGTTDRSVVPFDSSDKDSSAGLRTYNNVKGLAMPDTIASYTSQGSTYVVTANEGDDRADWTCFSAIDDARVKDLDANTTAFPTWDVLKTDAELGRSKVNPNIGDADGDGKYEQFFLLGSRSMSIFKDGKRIYDSAALLEELQIEQFGVANINGSHSLTASTISYKAQDRSDDKGPEPEGVAVGMVGSSRVAVLGLERMSALVFFDITNPEEPEVIQWEQLMPTNTTATSNLFKGDKWSPEGIVFIPANKSPNKKALVITSYELSGTISIHQIEK